MHNKPIDKWTRDELTLKCGPKELAIAVIKQWHEDGEPKADKPAIDYWFKIIKLYEEKENNSNETKTEMLTRDTGLSVL